MGSGILRDVALLENMWSCWKKNVPAETESEFSYMLKLHPESQFTSFPIDQKLRILKSFHRTISDKYHYVSPQ